MALRSSTVNRSPFSASYGPDHPPVHDRPLRNSEKMFREWLNPTAERKARTVRVLVMCLITSLVTALGWANLGADTVVTKAGGDVVGATDALKLAPSEQTGERIERIALTYTFDPTEGAFRVHEQLILHPQHKVLKAGFLRQLPERIYLSKTLVSHPRYSDVKVTLQRLGENGRGDGIVESPQVKTSSYKDEFYIRIGSREPAMWLEQVPHRLTIQYTVSGLLTSMSKTEWALEWPLFQAVNLPIHDLSFSIAFPEGFAQNDLLLERASVIEIPERGKRLTPPISFNGLVLPLTVLGGRGGGGGSAEGGERTQGVVASGAGFGLPRGKLSLGERSVPAIRIKIGSEAVAAAKKLAKRDI